MRVVTEAPLFRWLDTDRSAADHAAAVDAFYAGLRDRMAADPVGAACKWRVMSLRLRRRARRGR